MSNPDLARNLEKLNNSALDVLLSSNVLVSKESGTIPEILDWVNNLNRNTECKVTPVPLRALQKWHFDGGMNLRHDTGRFFSIEGIRVQTNRGKVLSWSQPIINQPEVGFLGILCMKMDGILHFLMQAKIEPGNINTVQLSPTLQATKSNYSQAHNGAKPLFLEYFTTGNSGTVILDQLQSEQGARFLKKRNRNIVIELKPRTRVDIPENFRWMTLGQIKTLLTHDNIVNMDTRTVLSSLSLPIENLFSRSESINLYENGFKNSLLQSLLSQNMELKSRESVLSWLTNLKMSAELSISSVDLNVCSEWEVTEMSISHVQRRYFEVIGADIKIVNREVVAWSQPLVRHHQIGIVGLLIKKFHGVHHLLIQAKMEPGNFDILEMAPTVQCITGSYTNPEYDVLYLEYFVGNKMGTIRYDTLLSEEGGRFYHEQNRYVVVELDEELDVKPDENYCWITFRQAKDFMKYNNYLNVELRSIISSISPI